MKFSVLMSVYIKENPSYLDECLDSLNAQTLQADEIVLIKDGPLTDELNSVISKWENILPLKIVGYKINRGLGYALNLGVIECSHDYIARMDTDDIACNDRFEKQINYLEKNKNISLLGGQILEFDNSGKTVKREVPCEYLDILKFLKSRNSFSHMTVMYKKADIIDAGNYLDFPGFEDYYLWARLANLGYQVANLPDVLVNARVGNDMIGRRIGFKYAKTEIVFFRELNCIGFISAKDFLKNILTRVPLRLLPKSCLKLVYKLLRKE